MLILARMFSYMGRFIRGSTGYRLRVPASWCKLLDSAYSDLCKMARAYMDSEYPDILRKKVSSVSDNFCKDFPTTINQSWSLPMKTVYFFSLEENMFWPPVSRYIYFVALPRS